MRIGRCNRNECFNKNTNFFNIYVGTFNVIFTIKTNIINTHLIMIAKMLLKSTKCSFFKSPPLTIPFSNYYNYTYKWFLNKYFPCQSYFVNIYWWDLYVWLRFYSWSWHKIKEILWHSWISEKNGLWVAYDDLQFIHCLFHCHVKSFPLLRKNVCQILHIKVKRGESSYFFSAQ